MPGGKGKGKRKRSDSDDGESEVETEPELFDTAETSGSDGESSSLVGIAGACLGRSNGLSLCRSDAAGRSIEPASSVDRRALVDLAGSRSLAGNDNVIDLSQDDDEGIWRLPPQPAHLCEQGVALSPPPSTQNRAAASNAAAELMRPGPDWFGVMYPAGNAEAGPSRPQRVSSLSNAANEAMDVDPCARIVRDA